MQIDKLTIGEAVLDSNDFNVTEKLTIVRALLKNNISVHA